MNRIADTVEEVVSNLGHLGPRRWCSVLRGKDPDEQEVEREAAEAVETRAGEEGLAHLLALEEDRALDDAHDLLMVEKDKLPEDWRVETPALCIGGRTRLDEAAACMLAELLRKRGLGAECLGPEAISAGNITSLQQTRAKLICLSYLGMEQSPAHLRYLIMRLRRILPTDCTILVGYWVESDEAELSEMKLASNADAYVTKLRDAVDYCVDRANEAAGVEAGAAEVSGSNPVEPGKTNGNGSNGSANRPAKSSARKRGSKRNADEVA